MIYDRTLFCQISIGRSEAWLWHRMIWSRFRPLRITGHRYEFKYQELFRGWAPPLQWCNREIYVESWAPEGGGDLVIQVIPGNVRKSSPVFPHQPSLILEAPGKGIAWRQVLRAKSDYALDEMELFHWNEEKEPKIQLFCERCVV